MNEGDWSCGPVQEGFEYFVLVPDLPYVSEGSVGGTLKQSCEDFQVTELLEVEPLEQDSDCFHWWLRVRRSGMTTRQVQEAIASKLGLDDFRDVGVAGLKDKRAVVTQWMSVPNYSPGLKRKIVVEDLDFYETLEIHKCRGKLKRGRHAGNAFRVVLSGCRGSLSDALSIAAQLPAIPNYFGQQRFGKGASTALAGAKLVLGKKKFRRRNPVHAFAVEAFGAMLFNIWLADVVSSGVPPDDRHGPLFGSKLRLRDGEQAVLDKAKVPLTSFPNSGGRRPAWLHFTDDNRIKIDQGATHGDLVFSFHLPTGAYATSVLREFVKDDSRLTTG